MSSFPKCGWRGVQPAQKCQTTPASHRAARVLADGCSQRGITGSAAAFVGGHAGSRVCSHVSALFLNLLPCFSTPPQGAWRKSRFFYSKRIVPDFWGPGGHLLNLRLESIWAQQQSQLIPLLVFAELISNNFSDLIFLLSWLSSRQISCTTFLMKQRNAWMSLRSVTLNYTIFWPYWCL